MGVFAWTCQGLSLYLWARTLYKVYAPLSTQAHSPTASFRPDHFIQSVRHALFAPPVAKKTRKRKHLTLAESQREELRTALKILVIWLLCKATEPIFDGSLGYFLPFYNVLKVLMLSFFTLCQAQLSLRLFDTFITPLGRPNTPLIDSTALTELILPTLHFLLSLPLAHLSVALKNLCTQLLSSWNDTLDEQGGQGNRHEAEVLHVDRVAPPNQHQRRWGGSEMSSAPVDGKRRPRGGGGSAAMERLQKRQSIGSLAARTRPSDQNATSRIASMPVRTSPSTSDNISRLQSLPSVPDALPDLQFQKNTSQPLPTFARIPTTPVVVRGKNDIVPPPSNAHPFLSPLMPGSLVERDTARTDPNSPTEEHGESGQQTKGLRKSRSLLNPTSEPHQSSSANNERVAPHVRPRKRTHEQTDTSKEHQDKSVPDEPQKQTKRSPSKRTRSTNQVPQKTTQADTRKLAGATGRAPTATSQRRSTRRALP